MKTLLRLMLLCTIIIGCGTPSKSTSSSKLMNEVKTLDPVEYASTITSDELKEMLYRYASDEFEGRDTGENGQKLAVEYIKSQYKALGIKSPLGEDDYFQEVPLQRQSVAKAKIIINGSELSNFESHIVLRTSENLELQTKEIAYVGYGIDSENYSDYKGIDVKGKIVLAKSGEPKDGDGNYVTSGKNEETKWTNGRQSLSSKREAAIANGAIALIYMDDFLFSRYAPYYQRQAASGSKGRLSVKNNKDELLMLLVNEEFGKALHKDVLQKSEQTVVQTNLEISVENKTEDVNSENVLAYIEGSEKPEEIIVLSAHLDHIGYYNGEICNGADDDGSGTVALIEIAEAFKKAKNEGNGAKRSLLFLHVTGEEKGLLGSSYYTDVEPIFPLENTVADLNIDMIGRTDPKRIEGERNYIYLIGSDKLSTDLHNISEAVNSKYCNLDLDYKFNDENDPNRYYYRSDHYNFAKNNIPVIFYFNGTHDDYHRPTDTPDKIEYDLLENRTRLVFHTAWELANRDERIVVDKATE